VYSLRVDFYGWHDVIAVVVATMSEYRQGVRMDGTIVLGLGIIQRARGRNVNERLWN
jgi:hypothetical protein